MVFIFHPLGTAGSGYGLLGSGVGAPGTFTRIADTAVVGFSRRCFATSVYRWCSKEDKYQPSAVHLIISVKNLDGTHCC